MRARRDTRQSVPAIALMLLLVACGRNSASETGAGDAPPPAPEEDSRATTVEAPEAIVYAAPADDAYQLFSSSLAGETPRRLSSDVDFAEFPVWSPDGTRLLFVGARNDVASVMVLDTSSGEVSEVLADNGNPADWGPRGERVLVTQSGADGRGLYVIDLETGEQRRLDTGSFDDAYARWARDGTVVVYESGRDGNPEIYVTRPESGETTRLTQNDLLDEWPSVSRDGGWIAWASGSEGDKNLWVMRTDGSGKRQLTEGLLFGDAFPEWSPDGTRILLTVRHNDAFVLKLVDVASGEITHVGDGAGASWR